MRGAWLWVAVVIAVGMVGSTSRTVEAQEPARASRLETLARIDRGEPDLRGTYVRARGSTPPVCGTAEGFAVVPPLYAGVTQILQSADYVVIRNQFDRLPRTVVFGGGTTGTAGRGDPARPTGRWDGDTLVLDSAYLMSKTLIALTGRAFGLSADVQVTERLTPLDDQTLGYEFILKDRRLSAGAWTIDFLLKRTSAAGHARAASGSCAFSPGT